jgi:hypothetical protein
MRRRILAMTLAFFLVGIPLPTRSAGIPALGVVTQASFAHFNTARVSAGATAYDGDRLSTESEGLLQFRGEGSLLYLPGQSGITLHGLPNSAQAHLRTGGLVFSSSRASAMEILANGAVIRPAADVPTVAQITLVGSEELQISARRGDLEFTYHSETEKIAEGASYRIGSARNGCRPFKECGNYAAWSQAQRFLDFDHWRHLLGNRMGRPRGS